MKALKYLSIICVLNMSCKKFLDVKPDNQILQETMFEGSEGVRIAVNGVYRLLSTQDLYGRNLTWGFASAISYNYDFWSQDQTLQDAASFKWTASTTQTITEQIWRKAFNTLANCNNLIQEVEQKDSSFFPEGSMEKNMILGEMYGIRAFVHFDMLRIFSPAPVTGYAGQTIPYVNSYPNYQPARLDMQTIFTRIIEDMEHAKNLLARVDTIQLVTPGSTTPIFRSANARIRSTTGGIDLPQGDFFNYRAQRMNFFAATALLARIHLYKGDLDKARANAQLIYDYQKKGWMQWTSASYQGQISDVDYVYIKRPDELLLCFNNNQTFNNYEQAINDGGQGSMRFSMSQPYIDKLFEGDLDDYRLVGWYNRYGDMRYLTWARPRGNSYNAEVVLKNQGQLLPALRFTEMYQILVECNAKQNRTADAVTILNDLRLRRGAKVKVPANATADQIMEILMKDVVRETLTEGQGFFFFKRLNRNIFNGETDRVMQPNEWYAPLPQSETAYQL